MTGLVPGDRGQTSLGVQSEVWKDALLLEVLGTLDEVNSHLGLARSLGVPEPIHGLLRRIQGELFQIGAELAAGPTEPKSPSPISRSEPAETEPLRKSVGQVVPLSARQVEMLGAEIAEWGARVPKVQKFILPAGHPAACQLHVARAVCRRAERRLTRLVRHSAPGTVSPWIQAYLNRLSDLLFILARSVNQQAGQQETAWEPPSPPEEE